MNRRSMFKAAVGSGLALLFPWRRAEAKPWQPGGLPKRDTRRFDQPFSDPRKNQMRRIQLVLQRWERKVRGSTFHAKLRETCKKHGGNPERDLESITYDAIVVENARTDDTIAIYWDQRNPDKKGQYSCGLALLTTSLAASMDDEKLLRHIQEAYCVAIMPPYVSRQRLLGPFNGKPVVIEKGKVVGGFKSISGEPSIV